MAWEGRSPAAEGVTSCPVPRANSHDTWGAGGPAQVSLLYACDGEAWKNHLRQVLLRHCSTASSTASGSCSSGSSSGQLTVVDCSLPQLERDLARNVMPTIAEADLQVVIMSPALLSFVAQRALPLDAVLDINRTLALLLGTTEQAVIDEQVEGLQSFPLWRKVTLLDKNWNCIREFLAFADGMLNRTTCCLKEKIDNSIDSVFEDRFTIATTYCDDKSYLVLYIMLNEPENPDDAQLAAWVSGVVDGSPYQQLFDPSWKNPYTAFIYMQTESLPDKPSVEVICGGTSWGKQPIRRLERLETFGRLMDALSSPVDFLCQVLGVEPGTTEELDSALTTKFKENCPPDMSQLEISNDLKGIETRGCRYPSLLHLAAVHGLTLLCGRLLDTPGGERALMIRNAVGQLPAELAAEAGHQLLAEQLQQATELSSLSKLIPRVDQRWSDNPDPDVLRSFDEWMRPDGVDAEGLPRQEDSPQSPLYAEIVSNQRNWADLDLDSLASGPYLTMCKREMPAQQYGVPPPLPDRPREQPVLPVRRDPAPGTSSERRWAAAVGSARLDRSGGLRSRSPLSDIVDDQGADGASSDDSASTYQSAENCTSSSRPSPTRSATARATRFALPPGAYQPATRRPWKLRTAEDDLRDLLRGYNNNEYTLTELKAIANSWSHRDGFQQFIRDTPKQKMGEKSQPNGFFSRFFPPAAKGKTKKSCSPPRPSRRSSQVPNAGGPQDDTELSGPLGPLKSPTFKSYLAPLSKETRMAVDLAKTGASLAMRTAAVATPPVQAPVPPSPVASPPASEPAPSDPVSEDVYMSMHEPVQASTAQSDQPQMSPPTTAGGKRPHWVLTSPPARGQATGHMSLPRKPPPVPPRRTPSSAGLPSKGPVETP